MRAATGAAVCAITAASLAACGSSESSGGGERLKVWIPEDNSAAVQAEFVERFNETSEIDIKLVQVPAATYSDRMREVMNGSSSPDLLYNWGAGSIGDFVADGTLLDLTDTLEGDLAFKNSFVPNILDGAMIEGHYYGIPMRGVQPVILFYNRTLFDEVGAEPPETFDDLLELIDTFLAEDITPVALGGGDPWTELMWLEYLLDRYGGPDVFRRIQDGETEAWGDPAMRWAAEAAADLVDAGAFGDDFGSVTYADDAVSTFFAEGGAAMHLMGSWEYPNQLVNQPKFAENDLAYTTFPVIEEGEGDPRGVVGNTSNYWSLNARLGEEGEEDRLAAAVEFLKLCATPDYAQALIDNGDVPATNNAEQLLDSHREPEYAHFQYDMVTQAPSFQLSWDQAVPASESETMINAIEKLFGGQLGPDEFIDEMLRNE
ncbi:extracellular solute-binding protein [Streptomyces sp. 6N223]|uniref:extracellular solute-binding protein n=1 Tax=Streptomyces sp. 6N223 TaxID=3457412 RepID=UPI003FCF3B6D